MRFWQKMEILHKYFNTFWNKKVELLGILREKMKIKDKKHFQNFRLVFSFPFSFENLDLVDSGQLNSIIFEIIIINSYTVFKCLNQIFSEMILGVTSP